MIKRMINRAKALGFEVRIPEYALLPGGRVIQFEFVKSGVEYSDELAAQLIALTKDREIAELKRRMGLYVHYRTDKVSVNPAAGRDFPADWSKVILREDGITRKVITADHVTEELRQAMEHIEAAIMLAKHANRLQVERSSTSGIGDDSFVEAVDGTTYALMDDARFSVTSALERFISSEFDKNLN